MSRFLNTNNALIFKYCLTTTYKRVLLNNQSCLSTSIAKHLSVKTTTTTIDQKNIQEAIEKTNLRSKSFHKYQRVMDVPEGLFRGKADRFNGVTVDASEEYDESVDFAEKLQKSIDYWIENGRRGVWFKVQTKHSQFIPELTKRGFDFHHAKNGYVMLFRWLPTDETVNIPVYAHTLCGVGGLVVNDKNEILAVSDKYALIPNSWKLPGGYVEPKEDFVDAAIREVREETGVETTFDTVIGVRQSHGGSFGCSDLYFVIALKPITSELKACPREISKVQWMPVSEYLQHPHVHETNRQFVRTFLHYKDSGIKFNCVEATHQILNRKYCLYLVEKEAEQK
ncbi:uncharacterized protein LOC129909830 [Episyrphus balteatus]|uniref:uncharacterized protein LOC129909830 n=1 Tax=Episyrphus balteatus TaxID=286459 RepID=UPI00248678BE|nr:uncharacterized protein LOC129909830 [Episyrphus balteatus]